jgi:hypothetical protein
MDREVERPRARRKMRLRKWRTQQQVLWKVWMERKSNRNCRVFIWE